MSCRKLREEITPVLERTLILDGDGSEGSLLAAGLEKKWKHTEYVQWAFAANAASHRQVVLTRFVISEPGELYKNRTTVFPKLRVWLLKKPESQYTRQSRATTSTVNTKPRNACDVVIARSVTTSDLVHLLNMPLCWRHSGTTVRTPVQRIQQVLVEACAYVSEASFWPSDVSFNLDAFDAAITFKYLHESWYPRAWGVLEETMSLLDRLFISESRLLKPGFALTSFDHRMWCRRFLAENHSRASRGIRNI